MTITPPVWLRARRSGDPDPDLASLVVTYRAIRHDLHRLTTRLGELAAEVEPVPPAHARAVCHYGIAVLAEIRRNHRDEDEVLWPVIAATAGQAIDLTPLTDDHEALEPRIARAERALEVLGSHSDAAAAHGQAAAAAADTSVRDLRVLLVEHLQEEEDQVVPVLRRFVPADAYHWCEQRIHERASVTALRFAVPWLARFADPGERSRLRATAGPDDRLLLAEAFRGYAALERRAFGGAGPAQATGREPPAP